MKRTIGMMVLALTLAGCGGAENASQWDPGKPHFSWDRVPVSAHLGLDDGLTPEQYTFLADHFDFITFTGGRMSREYRTNKEISFERIITTAARTIKARNPKARILFYWSGDFGRDHAKLSNATLPKGTTFPYEKGSKTVQLFDTRNPALRSWWAGVAAKAVKEYSCDGIYLDGGTAYSPGSSYERNLGKAKSTEMEQGMFAMLNEAKTKMGKDSIILLNPLHGPKKGQAQEDALGWRYLDYVDGAMVDDFDRAANVIKKRQSTEYIAATIKTMSVAAKRGEIVVFKAWPGFTWWSDPELMKKPHAEQLAVAKKNLEFPLACFLVGAGEHSYFCYTWGWLGEYGTFDWYPEFDKPLGPPKGDAVQTGWVFKREFKHASVVVDLEKRFGKITWNK
ncbi:MAG: hypothetical protein HN909_04225 [Phycisphaerales bacterium]|jgi:hypothetical protein|nr:hypothetical protein [Phycisphaerales bacterium]MBT7170958.1 hypothetical protein [Phycisphaerales bacterium]